MQNPKPSANVEGLYRSMLVIWAGLLMSQLIFFVLVYVTRPQLFRWDFTQPIAGTSGAMVLGFAASALCTVFFSFAFRKRLNERAVAAQEPVQVQSGLIIALALCEASSLFGLTLAFAFEYQYFFAFIALGILAMIAHFPTRGPLHAASYKNGPGTPA